MTRIRSDDVAGGVRRP